MSSHCIVMQRFCMNINSNVRERNERELTVMSRVVIKCRRTHCFIISSSRLHGLLRNIAPYRCKHVIDFRHCGNLLCYILSTETCKTYGDKGADKSFACKTGTGSYGCDACIQYANVPTDYCPVMCALCDGELAIQNSVNGQLSGNASLCGVSPFNNSLRHQSLQWQHSKFGHLSLQLQ